MMLEAKGKIEATTRTLQRYLFLFRCIDLHKKNMAFILKQISRAYKSGPFSDLFVFENPTIIFTFKLSKNEKKNK